jgi:tetratricopeptide (TPR) repeat protein
MPLAPSGVEWDQLLRHLDLADEFNLIFLICPSAQHAEAARQACEAHIRENGGILDYLMPLGAEEIRHLARLLLAPPQERVGDVLWVSLYPDPNILSGSDGLKELRKWTSAMSHGLAALNQARNQFARSQGRPVILAGTSQLLDACSIVAPDLWSIRRSVIHLPASGTTASGTENVFGGSEIRLAKEGMQAVEPPAASLADAERALAAAAKVRGKPGAKFDLLRYLIRAATALEGRGHVEDLRRVLNEALEVVEQSGLPDSPIEFSTLLINLASRLVNVGRYTEAETLVRQALLTKESTLGLNHAEVATTLNNLAMLLKETNRVTEAEPLIRRALAIDERSFGPDHSEVATDLNNLASLLAATNRLAEAELLYRRALAIDERSFGPNHPKVANRLNNLAVLLEEANQLAEAEPLIRRALAIDERSFGPDHPEVAVDLNNLASLLKETNRLTEAEPLYRRALAIVERSFGPDHPNVAHCLNNLAMLLADANRLTEAEPLIRRALAITERSFGPDHPNVANRLNNLASLLVATNRLTQAEPLYRRALAIDEMSFGPDHPEVATDLNNLASLLGDTNRLAEAESLFRRAVRTLLEFQVKNHHEHPWIESTIRSYSGLLKKMGRSQEEIEEEIEKAREEVKRTAQRVQK